MRSGPGFRAPLWSWQDGIIGSRCWLTAACRCRGNHWISQRPSIVALQGSTEPGVGPASFTLVVLVGAILLKEGLFRWVSLRAKVMESRALQTEAWHHRSDALTSLAAAVGISAALIGGPAWAQADAWAALFPVD